ncbi:MAG TPA: thiamine pyrophosphate-dependent enzyme [Candidatus Sumerlaeota bacterium]|nr:thiamine pyrophosphate-dependent enzyme [Candidatus Sumerlaeota bacterium]
MTTAQIQNPLEKYLRMERIPHIWCPGCGIGTALNCFIRTLDDTGVAPDKICVVSGIGCSGRVAGYLNLDTFHTTHGRAIPFATGLKLANPDLKVIVFSGDGDLVAIGGNHFIHAAQRNIDITVICINNFNYAMTGGQYGPTTPIRAKASTAPHGSYQMPFNLPKLAESSGAVYVARWTTYHVRQLTMSMKEAIHKKGFSFVEVISPCPTLYGRKNQQRDARTSMLWYRDHSVKKDHPLTSDVNTGFRTDIVVGKFVDIERHTFLDDMNMRYEEIRQKNME